MVDGARTESGYSVKADGRWHRTGKTDPREAAESFALERGWPARSWRYSTTRPSTKYYGICRRRFKRVVYHGCASPVDMELSALIGGYLVPPQ